MIISHIKQDNNQTENWLFQTNEEHCKGVAEFAEKFASDFGFGKWGISWECCMIRELTIKYLIR